MLRPWLEGKLAGCLGGEPLALGLLEGGWGSLYSTPGPGSQCRAACHSRGKASFQIQEECVWKWAFAAVGAGVRTLAGRVKDTPCDYSLYRFPRLLFSTVHLLIPGRDIKEEIGLGICGGGKEAGRERWGQSKLSPFQQHLFPFISLP